MSPHPDCIALELTAAELDFIANILAQVSYGNVAQANMLHLWDKLKGQAQQSVAQAQAPLKARARKARGNGAAVSELPPRAP